MSKDAEAKHILVKFEKGVEVGEPEKFDKQKDAIAKAGEYIGDNLGKKPGVFTYIYDREERIKWENASATQNLDFFEYFTGYRVHREPPLKKRSQPAE